MNDIAINLDNFVYIDYNEGYLGYHENFKVPSTHPLTGDLGYGNWQEIDCDICENPQFDSYWGSTNPISGNQPNNIMWCCDNYTSCDDFHNPNANTLGIDNVSPID